MSNNTTNAPEKFLVLHEGAAELVLAAGSDVEAFLNAQARGPAGSCPGPVMTRKFQTNMPRAYGPLLDKLQKKFGTTSEAATLRCVVQAGLLALGFSDADVVDEG